MSNTCSLCTTELTSMDKLLGENKLSDGGVLCNKCLDKISYINQEVLYNLNQFSINDIQQIVQNKNTEQNSSGITPQESLPMAIAEEPQNISKEEYKRRKLKIKADLEKLKANLSVFAKGEVKELPSLIPEDETMLGITDAQFVNTLAAGVLVATSKRIISVSKAMFGAAKINDYPNETIKSVSFVTNPRSPIIKLHLEERVVEFECFMDKEDAEKFYDIIRPIYNNPVQQPQQQIDSVNTNTETPASTTRSLDILEQLEKLGKLRESGILTDTEFTEQKRKLLEQLK
ncbi:PH domain-containing protein [Chryseobacterium indologenes]|uniref:PH domain-containing protein n=1 Tax=Chryseobacterium indologenes TaxID=253 RepID=UPI0025787A29|nr:PH domain-containing protein [Chryseobacterium indologenes]MDM1554726.1 PH domain-containing protein [Chryseobacterium indologenes]